AASSHVTRAILREMQGTIDISVALGELLEPSADALEDLAGASFAKLGLSRCAVIYDWSRHWCERIAQFPLNVAPVVVSYAEAGAEAPPPRHLLEAAAAAKVRFALVDTFDKRRGRLLDHWSIAEVKNFIRDANRLGIKVALAGSLNFTLIQRLLPL